MYRKEGLLTNSSTPGEKSAGLGHEPVNVRQTFIPQLDGDVDYVRHKAESGKRRVKKKCEEAAFVSAVFLKHWWSVLRGHEHDQGHVEVVRDGGERQGVVRVYN